ncbi:hypothetical protein KAFR_0A03070 [Kazachstania africana CBS 2517]|uniref:RNase III domain-containing protein n=1 Tax=Kazachstania africana (strain ATCC 22294 / BCRC 22015 / CBS 2517 / CECT 1963 / NBRC 1671 / NRRL Y-8276) TaxID=1071382 RepID=H2AMZ2_KAZAF|nr:hypothetical protein KAFR_0A03070 [Kazachstania africana CBS 2517]CCF55742.1 hypothetical protein KAFR_0A03070 [Kazachstania africana CBS 2517]
MEAQLVPITQSPYTERDAHNLRKFYKIQNACSQLEASINVLYENALSTEEIDSMLKHGTNLEKLIAASPAMHVASRLKAAKKVLDIQSVFKQYNFESDNSPVDEYIHYPICTDRRLENLAFIHSSYPNMNVKLTETQKIVMCNERLEFLGDSWLGALVAYIIYNKYPYADEGALSKMKDAIVSNSNLEKICTKLGFKERLLENIPRSSMKIKNKFSKYYADCVEAYIGALVVDRFSAEFKDIADWLTELAQEHFEELGPDMFKKPLNKNAKGELAEFLQFNKLGLKLAYVRVTNKTPFKVQLKLGTILLAEGQGPNVREAEHRAAMEVLANKELIEKYSLCELENNDFMNHVIEEASEKDQKEVKIEIGPGTTNYGHMLGEEKSSTSDPLLATTGPNSQSSTDPNSIMKEIMDRMTSLVPSLISEAIESIIQEDNSGISISEPSMSENEPRQLVENDNSTKFSKNNITIKHSNKPPEDLKTNDIEYDKESSGRLYALLGSIKLHPDYEIFQEGPSEFHAICSIKGTGTFLGEGTGRSKKIAQHIAAGNALNSEALQDILTNT